MFVRLVSLLLATMISCAAAPVAKLHPNRLRRLAAWPKMNATVGIAFSGEDFTTLYNGGELQTAIASRIAVLRQQMKGDATDAARYLRLGELYTDAGDDTNACQAYSRAVGLYRPQVSAQPTNGLLLTQFGTALWLVETNFQAPAVEAERLLEMAVQMAPRQWQCWAGLGDFREGQASQALWSSVSNSATFHLKNCQEFQRFLSTLHEHPPTPAQLERWNASTEAAVRCFGQAVDCAPADPAVFLRRWRFDGARTWWATLLEACGTTSDPCSLVWRWMGKLSQPDSLADLRQFARLSRTNYLALGFASWMDLLNAAPVDTNGVIKAWPSWRRLPARSREFLRWAQSDLEQFSRIAEPTVAAGAAETVGILRVLTSQSGAIRDFRRAVALDPSRDQAWDALTGLLVLSPWHTKAEAVAVCENRVRAAPSPRSHLLLAKAFDLARQTRKAEQELRLVLKQTPDDISANLALAAVLLRQSQDGAKLAEAGEVLAKAYNLLARGDTNTRLTYALDAAVYCALTGDLATARQWAQEARKLDAGNKSAKRLLVALGNR